MAPFWHRWSYFSILNLSLLSLIDKFPLISALKIFVTRAETRDYFTFLFYNILPENQSVFRRFSYIFRKLSLCGRKMPLFHAAKNVFRQFSRL